MIIHWLILVMSLPGRSGTPRMRIWRALKAGGAGSLRDGVYVLPKSNSHTQLFRTQVDQIRSLGGTACVLEHRSESEQGSDGLMELFDRTGDYQDWHQRVEGFRETLSTSNEAEARRAQTQFRRELDHIASLDFFPDEPKRTAEDTMRDIEEAVQQHFSPNEPIARDKSITPLDAAQYQHRTWATRKNLWVDRVASAWLIRRFIDSGSRFTWLEQPQDCAAEEVGFDFDDAEFSHVGDWVTFEVLLRSFDLMHDKALRKLGELVHYLDVGGVPEPDAYGFVTMLSGARQTHGSDDEFLDTTSILLDTLYAAYQREPE